MATRTKRVPLGVDFPPHAVVMIIQEPGVICDTITLSINGGIEQGLPNRDEIWKQLHHLTTVGRTIYVKRGTDCPVPWIESAPYQARKAWL